MMWMMGVRAPAGPVGRGPSSSRGLWCTGLRTSRRHPVTRGRHCLTPVGVQWSRSAPDRSPPPRAAANIHITTSGDRLWAAWPKDVGGC
jgi:hypothetical protein